MNLQVIYNPWAGPWPAGPVVEKAVELWRELGWQVEVKPTGRAGDARRLASQAAADRADAVVVAGGDGTLSQAADGLAGTETALGLLPLGTANLWAQEIGLAPLLDRRASVERAAGALARARVRRVDLGLVEGRHFMLWLGAGLDGHIVSQIEPRNRLGKLLGIPFYLVAAVLAALRWRGRTQSVTVDGVRQEGRLLLTLVGNSRLYAGGLFRLSPEARMDDGLFDVWVLEGDSFLDALAGIWALFRRKRVLPGVRHAVGRAISITANRPLPVQADGDFFGRRRVLSISVRPRALRVLVPDTAPADLFTSMEEGPAP